LSFAGLQRKLDVIDLLCATRVLARRTCERAMSGPSASSHAVLPLRTWVKAPSERGNLSSFGSTFLAPKGLRDASLWWTQAPLGATRVSFWHVCASSQLTRRARVHSCLPPL